MKYTHLLTVSVALVLLATISIAEQANTNWDVVQKLINEANATDKRLLNEASGKGMGDAAKAESGRAWKKVKAHLESLSLSELMETASAASESVSKRSELKEEWEREVAATSNAELILSVYMSKNPRQSDIDDLLSRVADRTQPVYFRVALFSWFRNQLMGKSLGAASLGQTQTMFFQKCHAALSDTQNPESVRLAAMNAYRDVVVFDIVSTCQGSKVLRSRMKSSDERNQLMESVCSGVIDVPPAVKMRLVDRNKDVLRLVEAMGKELQKEDCSLRFKTAVGHSLRQLKNTPLGTLQREKVSRLQSQVVKNVKSK